MERGYEEGIFTCCALVLYKPELGKRMLKYLLRDFGIVEEHLTCCQHAPGLETGTEVVITCPGCDRRYRQLYEGISTISDKFVRDH